MSEYHYPFDSSTYAGATYNSADQGGTYHNGAIFALDLSSSTTDTFTAVAKLQVKVDPASTTYADYTATPTLFSVSQADAATVKTFVVSPSASADLDAFMPRLWRVNLVVTSAARTAEVQTLTLSSWDSNDTIKLTYNAHESVAVTKTGTQTSISAAFQAALEGLVDFVPGDVVVTNGVDSDHFVFTFASALGNVTNLTATSGTGGASGAFANTTPGHMIPTLAMSAQMLNG